MAFLLETLMELNCLLKRTIAHATTINFWPNLFEFPYWTIEGLHSQHYVDQWFHCVEQRQKVIYIVRTFYHVLSFLIVFVIWMKSFKSFNVRVVALVNFDPLVIE